MKQVNIGIDLGTTNSLIAKYEQGEVIVYKNPVGFKETLPSVVAFRPDRVLIGDKAREYLSKDAANVFSSFKRKMGTDEKYYIVNKDENITPVELSSMVLKELKGFVRDNNTEATVITIPASFNTMQSNATLKAGEEAGFKKVYLLQEPIAAALAYFNNKNSNKELYGKWIVYDLGGGTFDVALIDVKEDGMKVIDNEGNNFLGGVDLDAIIVEQLLVPALETMLGKSNFIEALTEKHGPYEKLYHQLMYFAEEAKKELSINEQTEIDTTLIIDDKPINFVCQINREQIHQLFLPKVNETIHFISKLLSNNNLIATDIKQIILVGGSTFNIVVREELSKQTGIAINTSIDPTTAIVVGAAYYASNKYYESTAATVGFAEDALNQAFENEEAADLPFSLTLSYNNTSRDTEEVLIIAANGIVTDYSYRIVRQDGGFDTGTVPLKNKKTEFLNLLPNHANTFSFKIYNHLNAEVKSLSQDLIITQGKFAIDGQPLPNDICIEIDDLENKVTKLEVIFERNSLLPQKRTLYRTISKTISKGSADSIVINIMEGNRNARPSSNIPIGIIEINGKDLKLDLIKGSDIEILLHIDESRILSTEVFLVMTKQEFKNVFKIAERVVSINRLKDQVNQLEIDLKENLYEYQYNENYTLITLTENLLEQVKECKQKLLKLKDKDNSDTKYVLAEKIWHISQESDKMGGQERIAELIERYLNYKDYVAILVEHADINKDKVKEKFMRVLQGESSITSSKNASVIENGIRRLDEVSYLANSNTFTWLVDVLNYYKSLPDNEYVSPQHAKQLLAQCDKHIETQDALNLKQTLIKLNQISKQQKSNFESDDFIGTGIG
jgi:molecular chaperone DnaK